jgi:hypothetical protein
LQRQPVLDQGDEGQKEISVPTVLEQIVLMASVPAAAHGGVVTVLSAHLNEFNRAIDVAVHYY